MTTSCFRLITLAWLASIAGCASNYDAPIEQKSALPSASRPVSQAASRVAANGLVERDHPPPALYVVASGDQLLTIAWRYGLDVRDLIRWNQITNPDLIVVGQTLRLRPLSPPPVVPPRAPSVSAAVPVVTPLPAASTASRESVPTVSAPPRISMVPPIGTAPNVASVVAGMSTSPATLAPSSAATAFDSDKGGAADSVTTNKEGVRWMWPTPGKVSAADASSATKGVDIRGVRGQAVKAAAAGAVVYSGSGLRGYGELIIIKHNDTFLSAYAHNEVRLVQEGRHVAAGESIARMGNSDASDVMLHFEIRRNGKAIDPLQYLPNR